MVYPDSDNSLKRYFFSIRTRIVMVYRADLTMEKFISKSIRTRIVMVYHINKGVHQVQQICIRIRIVMVYP